MLCPEICIFQTLPYLGSWNFSLYIPSLLHFEIWQKILGPAQAREVRTFTRKRTHENEAVKRVHWDFICHPCISLTMKQPTHHCQGASLMSGVDGVVRTWK